MSGKGRFLLLAIDALVVTVNACFFGFAGGFAFNNVANLTILVTGAKLVATNSFGFITDVALLLVKVVILNGGFTTGATCYDVLLSMALSFLRHIYPVGTPLASRPVLRLYFTVTLPTLNSTVLFGVNDSDNNASVVTVVLGGCSDFGVKPTLVLSSLLVAVTKFFVFSVGAKLCSLLKLAVHSFVMSAFVRGFGLSGCFGIMYSSPRPVYTFVIRRLGHDTDIFRTANTCSNRSGTVILATLGHARTIHLHGFVGVASPGTFVLVSGADRVVKGKFRDV